MNFTGGIIPGSVRVQSKKPSKIKRRKDAMAFRSHVIVKGVVVTSKERAPMKSVPFGFSRWHVYRGGVYKRRGKRLRARKFRESIQAMPKVKRFILTPENILIPFNSKKHVLLPEAKAKK